MFPPAFGPRMGYLCKYLRRNGWNPVVVAEYVDENTFSFLGKDVEVSYIRYYRRKGLAGKIEWGMTFLCDILFGYKDRRLYREALKKSEQHPFGLILCSAYRTFPLPAARRLARKTGLPLVVDLRDIIEQYAGNEFITHKLPGIFGLQHVIASVFRRRNLAVRNKILSEAACVTTVSPWHVSVLKAYNENTHLIYNGFDPDIFYPSNISADQFFITYTGRLFSVAMRDPGLLFQAVERLAGEKTITPGLFRLRWFVDDKSRRIIEAEVRTYPGVAAFMDYPGYVPAAGIPRKLNESAILLLLTNKTGAEGPKGIMTTKFFESLAVEKPVLCVRGDEGCLEDVINRTRAGLSAHNADEVYDFIKNHYLRWQEGKPCETNPDKNEIKKFSREEQARQFIGIFEQVIKREAGNP
ncbi:MAG: glycosyltransferase [Tannerella sp.]|jgi:glycosyltransferase involved in cell wall biosynthesis|nr:glycosyltransferase [Tannerella sp.]